MSFNPFNPWLIAATSVLVAVMAVQKATDAKKVRNAALGELGEVVVRNAELDERIAGLTRALASNQSLQSTLSRIDRQGQQLRTLLDGQSNQINRNLEELKRSDKAIMDYFSGPVPAAVGLRYARNATTDPAAYRSGAAVQPGPVPAAATAAPDSH